MSHVPPRTFGSLAPALVTPFNADGSLDLDSAQAIARKLVSDGCDTILLSGTTGESPTTHQPEKDDLTRAVVEAVGDRAFILCGAGSNDTAHAVRIAQSAQACGADGLLVVSPYYNRPSQAGVRAHVRAIVEGTDLPVMLYDIPGRTGVAFGDESLDELSTHPRILAVKDATGKVEQGVERMHRTGLEYYSGDDGLNFAWLTGGASGIISVVAHVAAPYLRRMVDLLDADEVWEARELSYSLRPLIHAIMGGGQGAVMAKWALHLQGLLPSPTLRLPLVPPSEAEVARVEAAMGDLDLL
ncbi:MULTISPECIES: 4-hydroxy-tetrahydrodipicolinate synthase [Actinomyces]|uniref:4-hydroxy-tetrahydrodipicolinate synthase n=1 Tax=Actinomyces TaxID=1654 RepID=UPI00096AAB47|nr:MULTISPECIES: 4-hydroxy-tetrahydrodipicolinate synthase [Actinomyces]